MFEGYAQLISYGAVFTNGSFIASNLLFNFGLMYTSFKDGLLWFLDNPDTNSANSYDAGQDIGQVLYYIMI